MCVLENRIILHMWFYLLLFKIFIRPMNSFVYLKLMYYFGWQALFKHQGFLHMKTGNEASHYQVLGLSGEIFCPSCLQPTHHYPSSWETVNVTGFGLNSGPLARHSRKSLNFFVNCKVKLIPSGKFFPSFLEGTIIQY